jgi:hypothetical protein
MDEGLTVFVELCAGSAAVALRLVGGEKIRPPVAYMGAKTRYAARILETMGLYPGAPVSLVVLVEPGPWGRVWSVLVDPGKCGRVADVLESWAGCEARALWARCKELYRSADEIESTAAFLFLQSREFRNKPVDERGDFWGPLMQWGNVRDPYCGRRVPTILGTVRRLRVLAGLTWPAVVVVSDIAESVCGLFSAGDRVFVYIDPPYLMSSKWYLYGLDREGVLDLARRWAAAGAVVCVSEREPLPLPGWVAVCITDVASSTQRTFTKDRSEWLTLFRPDGDGRPGSAGQRCRQGL